MDKYKLAMRIVAVLMILMLVLASSFTLIYYLINYIIK